MLDRFIRSRASNKAIEPEAAPELHSSNAKFEAKSDEHTAIQDRPQERPPALSLDELFSEMLLDQPILGLKV